MLINDTYNIVYYKLYVVVLLAVWANSASKPLFGFSSEAAACLRAVALLF